MMSLLETLDVNNEFQDDTEYDREASNGPEMVIAQRMTLKMKMLQKRIMRL